MDFKYVLTIYIYFCFCEVNVTHLYFSADFVYVGIQYNHKK